MRIELTSALRSHSMSSYFIMPPEMVAAVIRILLGDLKKYHKHPGKILKELRENHNEGKITPEKYDFGQKYRSLVAKCQKMAKAAEVEPDMFSQSTSQWDFVQIDSKYQAQVDEFMRDFEMNPREAIFLGAHLNNLDAQKRAASEAADVAVEVEKKGMEMASRTGIFKTSF